MNYYKILGVETNASLVDINRAYRKLSLQFNPEKNLHEGGFYIKMFNQVQEAYKILGDENKRKAYDIENGYIEDNCYKIVKFEIDKSEVRAGESVLISWETIGEGSVGLEGFGLLEGMSGELEYQIPNYKKSYIEFTLHLFDKNGLIAATQKCEVCNISYLEDQKELEEEVIFQEYENEYDDNFKEFEQISNNQFNSTYVNDTKSFAKNEVYITGKRIGRLGFLGRSIGFLFLFGFLVAIFENEPALTGMISLVNLIVFFVVAKLRLHDMNYSGWYSLLILIPFVNLLLLIYLFFVPGTDGQNQYGLRK